MTDLLIHSLAEFSELILKALELTDTRNVVEIGVADGRMSGILAEYCRRRGGQLSCVDPNPGPEFLSLLADTPDILHVKAASLHAMADLTGVDCWIIDGDHNWYTVYHELSEIMAICRRDRKPFLVVLHDVGWPLARRDLYYQPEQIPAEYRHPHSFDDGVTLDSNDLVKGSGFRGMGSFALATIEGGPRNGVLTAIEDFMAGILKAGSELRYLEVPAVFGLGILFDPKARWSSSLSQCLQPYHRNKLLMSLENNRLRNYLRVIELQDLLQEVSAGKRREPES